MIEASCHCGAVRLEIAQRPERLTSCNCSICRRLGALWAGTVTLVAAHPDEPAITIMRQTEPVVWGVVTWVLHPC